MCIIATNGGRVNVLERHIFWIHLPIRGSTWSPEEVGTGIHPSHNNHYACDASKLSKLSPPCIHLTLPHDCLSLPDVQLPKDELNKQNFKHANSNSCLPLGQPLVRPENTSSSSSEFEGKSQRKVLTLSRNL